MPYSIDTILLAREGVLQIQTKGPKIELRSGQHVAGASRFICDIKTQASVHIQAPVHTLDPISSGS